VCNDGFHNRPIFFLTPFLTVFRAFDNPLLRLVQDLSEPSILCFVVAIVLSSIVFGLGHLPLAFVMETQVTTSVIAYVILGNSFFGLISGYLYWRRGLEAAMISHMLVHVVMVTAARLAR
jgi:membrane protease YdiL (CAAX protease family)